MSNERTSTRRTAASRIGDQILSLLAVAGSLCIVLVVLGVFFQISIMMFRTGSMSPTITAGSIAFVREIPAAQIAVDDVVTVEQKHAILPVTHRVVEILDVDDSTGFATFTMKGDANESLDAAPYAVPTVKRVLFSVPAIAPVIQWFSNPKVIGGLTLGATALVVWAFWPRRSDEEMGDLTHPANLSVALPMFLLAPMLLNSSASSTDLSSANLVTGDYLSIESRADYLTMQNLSPGDSTVWSIDVWADAPEPGSIDLSLSVGSLQENPSDLLTFTVVDCPVTPGTSPALGCPDGARTLIKNSSARTLQERSSDAPQHLVTFSAAERHRLLITGTISKNALHDSGGDSGSNIRISASGSGEVLSMTPPRSPKHPNEERQDQFHLSDTGIGNWQWLVIAGGILTAVGATLHHGRKRVKP